MSRRRSAAPRCLWIILVTTSCWTALVEAKDVAIVYDVSGSMNVQRREALRAANTAVIGFLTDGLKPDPSRWLLKGAPSSGDLWAGANLRRESRVLYLAFNQPDQCSIPYFKSTTAIVRALEDAPTVLHALLPDPGTMVFKNWTYLELAKWQAAEELERTSLNVGPWLFIVVSDFIKDMERGPCANSPQVMEKIQEYNTQFDEETLLQANWLERGSRVSLFGFRVYKVSAKSAPLTPKPKPEEPKPDERPAPKAEEKQKPAPPSPQSPGWGFLWIVLIGLAILVVYHGASRFWRRS